VPPQGRRTSPSDAHVRVRMSTHTHAHIYAETVVLGDLLVACITYAREVVLNVTPDHALNAISPENFNNGDRANDGEGTLSLRAQMIRIQYQTLT
jgi:hypothetical protein